MYFLLCFLILPDYLARKSILIFVIPIVLIVHNYLSNGISESELLKTCLVFLISVVALIPSIFSIFNQKYTLNIWIYLLVSFLLFGLKHGNRDVYFVVNNEVRLFFCWCSLALLFFYSFINTDYSQGDLAFNAYNNDKNYAAFIVFLMFMIYMKFKFWPGIIYPFIFFVFCNKSRGLVLCLLVFFVIHFGKRFIKRTFRAKRFFTFAFCIISTVAIIGFSYLFMYGTAFSVIGGYRDSLVDSSNKMRFNANIYAVNLIMNNNLLWSGFGSDLTVQIGVDDGMGDGMVNLQYNGFRLVQSHDSVINIITRVGIIPALLYLYVFGLIADKYKSYENIEYYYSFLLYGLILNYYYGPWLIAWYFILSLDSVDGNQKYILYLE